MANEIYHKSNWGNPEKDGWGDVYFNPSATNRLYTRSDNYENVEGTDKALASKPDTQSVLMTPTAYSVGSMNSILPPYEVLPTELITNGDFATDSDWTKGTGWSIGDGRATSDASANSYLNQQVYEIGKKYKLNFEVLEGTIELRSAHYSKGTGFYTTGTYSIEVIPNATSTYFYVYTGFGQSSIDNVSVKEVRNADFTFDRNSTATRVNKEGLIETVAIDTPRLDYPFIDGVVQSEPALLLEPARTNLFTYSEDFNSVAPNWVLYGGATIISNNTISPDGTLNADKLSDAGGIYSQAVYNPNINYVFSLFIKKNTATGLLMNFVDQASGYLGGTIVYTYSTNSIQITQSANSSISAESLDYGNGWIRLIMKFTTNVAQNYNYQFIESIGGDSFIWGAQLEAGSYATSYIPTNGSSVTRIAETASGSGNSEVFNDSEGVLFADIAALANDLTNRKLSISNGTSSQRIILSYSTVSNTLDYDVVNSTQQADISHTLTDIKLFSKVAAKYKTNDFSLWVNGFEVGVGNSGLTPTGLSELNFDRGFGGESFYGKTKEIGYYDTVLTDLELETLTSYTSWVSMVNELNLNIIYNG